MANRHQIFKNLLLRDRLFDSNLFLAHLAQRYWGCPSSCVVCHASCVVNNYINIFSSESTGQNLTKLHQKHPWGGGETNDTERNFDPIIILVSMATERKKLNKRLKNLLLQN